MPPLFNSDSNFRLNYFGLKFYLLAAKFIFIFCPWLINFWFYLPNPSPTGAKVKGRGITWHFSPVSVPIRTQLDIYCPVDLYCLLSVSDDSVPILWLCDYSEGFMVFTLFFTGWIDFSRSNSHVIKILKYSKFLWVWETSASHKYSLLDWGVSFHNWKIEGITKIISSVKTTLSDNYFYSIRLS